MLWPADQIVSRVSFALEKQVSLRDCIGFRVDLLAVEMSSDLLAMLFRNLLKRFLCYGHAQ